MNNTILEVKDLNKSYGKFHAIKDINLSLHEGEIIGLIGPNGAGKSTTIKCILNLLNKDSGSVLFFNRDIDKNFVKIMHFVGYASSENSMYENMKVIDFLKYANSFYEIDYMDNINTLAQKLSLDLNNKICNLSLGNKRKVAIINALFHNPKLVILDEPTNGLDPLARIALEKIIMDEKKKGTSFLYSSHNLEEVQTLCDNVIIIKQGEIIPNIDIKAIQKSHKKVIIQTKEPINSEKIAFEGAKDINVEDNKATFLYSGEASNLIKKLNSFDLVDVSILDPSLEEIFLHYYN